MFDIKKKLEYNNIINIDHMRQGIKHVRKNKYNV